ncbi:hypothetical protein LIER_24730 [Lithospermum erythrorhizon]|uniref:Reverse transcriptase zinc-binding domain-containing protein n=1 Tax=Lithospermum erythrorhizon TaxID=34254 RepID=A0AAV3R238_LITER
MGHLFFECAYSATIWRLLLQKLGSYRQGMCWNEEKQWIIANLKGKSFRKQIGRLVLGCAVSAIWTERNSRTFTSVNKSTDQLLFSIFSNVAARGSSWKRVKRTQTNLSLCLEWGIDVRCLMN